MEDHDIVSSLSHNIKSSHDVCRLGSGFLKRIPSILQGWIQLLLGNGKGISL